ncbi:MAG: glycosyltransferase family 2 protein [Actinomycetota bacterium]
MPPPARVSILMPCYGLAGPIAANINRVVAATAAEPGVEVVVVDDGSPDGTREEAERAAARHPGMVVVVANPQNAGKGRALQRAFAASSGETVVFLDGDLDLPPEQIPALVAALHRGGFDALLGTKRAAMVAGGYPRARRVLSRLFSAVTRFAFRLPVTETQTGLKAFRREPLGAALPRVQIGRYSFDLELVVLMHRAGCRIGEFPVELRAQASTSRVTVGTLWEMGRDTVRLWFRTTARRRP